MAAKLRKLASCVSALMLIVLAMGSSNPGSVEERSTEDTMEGIFPTEEFGVDFGGFHSGDCTIWPDNIPEDIPVLNGDIYTLMEAPGPHTRLLYQNITEQQVEEYLSQLEEEGFRLEFIVYVEEGFPDRSDEKIERGEFDPVDITKGEYRMRLEFGVNGATYDIYASGFEDEVATANALLWPETLAVLVSASEKCELMSIYSGHHEGGYYITSKTEDDNVLQDYLQVLKDLGFEEQHKFLNQNGTILIVTLNKGQTAVDLMSESSDSIGVRVSQNNPHKKSIVNHLSTRNRETIILS